MKKTLTSKSICVNVLPQWLTAIVALLKAHKKVPEKHTGTVHVIVNLSQGGIQDVKLVLEEFIRH